MVLIKIVATATMAIKDEDNPGQGKGKPSQDVTTIEGIATGSY
jgi:hypothetical protein